MSIGLRVLRNRQYINRTPFPELVMVLEQCADLNDDGCDQCPDLRRCVILFDERCFNPDVQCRHCHQKFPRPWINPERRDVSKSQICPHCGGHYNKKEY